MISETAILPFMFIFNHELLLIGVDAWWHGILVFISAVAGGVCIRTGNAALAAWALYLAAGACAGWHHMFVLLRPDCPAHISVQPLPCIFSDLAVLVWSCSGND